MYLQSMVSAVKEIKKAHSWRVMGVVECGTCSDLKQGKDQLCEAQQ